MEGDLIHPELSYKITGLLFKVHNDLGRFSREKQYGDLFENLLKCNNISYKRELRIADSGNILDFIVEDKIIVELKAKRIVTKDDYYQVQRYLQETGIKLALLINFRRQYLTPKRIIRIGN